MRYDTTDCYQRVQAHICNLSVSSQFGTCVTPTNYEGIALISRHFLDNDVFITKPNARYPREKHRQAAKVEQRGWVDSISRVPGTVIGRCSTKTAVLCRRRVQAVSQQSVMYELAYTVSNSNYDILRQRVSTTFLKCLLVNELVFWTERKHAIPGLVISIRSCFVIVEIAMHATLYFNHSHGLRLSPAHAPLRDGNFV